MPQIVQFGATLMCPHGAPVSVVPASPRVFLGGQPAATMADGFIVTGCPFLIPVGAGTKPQPCVKVQWTVPATRVFVNKQPAILQSSSGVAQSVEQIPQGPPSVVVTQLRAGGT